MVKAKLYCTHKEYAYNGRERVKFSPVGGYHEPETSDDNVFGKATPNGSIELTMVQNAADYFHIGRKYYVTFEDSGEVMK
jgi:hypothetical protein